MTPDNIPPEVGLPVGAALWAVVLLPHVARYLRARRAARKARR
jgi:hypothetical protein